MNKYSNVIGKCYDTIINELLGAKNAPENKRIPHMCCDYLKYLKCCEDGLAGKCEPKHIETGIWFTRMVFGDAINLLCGDYTEESDKCSKLGLTKQVASILIYSLKNSIAQLCSKESKKLDELIASTKCINTATPEINRCYTNLIDGMLGTLNAPDNKKIPHVCCEYYRIFPCISTKTKRIPVCTEQHVETALNFVKSMLGNAIDLICSDYTEGSDKCETLGRPPKKLKSQRRTKIVCAVIGVSYAADCDVNEARRIDGAMARLLTIGNSGRSFPESKGDDLKQYCE
ncbi:unnamed protein product [Oppiella nova]|uniref:Uncharacterized protein n=1 Tax=Oppiella nova TaxID=334625 RepID=A0A7R9M835_9ACAR|nr:unnamed protein product [Oppiella nova]CAG2172557.1 unnamed protein product [Oppiella nova]